MTQNSFTIGCGAAFVATRAECSTRLYPSGARLALVLFGLIAAQELGHAALDLGRIYMPVVQFREGNLDQPRQSSCWIVSSKRGNLLRVERKELIDVLEPDLSCGVPAGARYDVIGERHG